MKCPNCNVSLVISDRGGVEIDYCPDCRGVWLDRGELDKIIERFSQNIQSAQEESYREKQFNRRENDYKYEKKKKGSFLGDLFDF